MFKRILSKINGLEAIPAAPEKRAELIRTIIRIRMTHDPIMRSLFEGRSVTVDDFSLEELQTWQEGMLVTETEKYLVHMDHYPQVEQKIGRAEFEALHVDHMIKQYNTFFANVGYEFSIDPTVVTVQGLITHFLAHQRF